MTVTAAFYVIAAAAAFLALILTSIMMRARHRRAVCPETGMEVEVSCDPTRAILATISDEPQHVVGCERWPKRAGCDRACEEKLISLT